MTPVPFPGRRTCRGAFLRCLVTLGCEPIQKKEVGIWQDSVIRQVLPPTGTGPISSVLGAGGGCSAICRWSLLAPVLLCNPCVFVLSKVFRRQ